MQPLETALTRTAMRLPQSRTGARMAGLGTALPSTVVANEQITELIGVGDAWIRRRTGIAERRHMAAGERLSDLAARAGIAALEDAGLAAESLDHVIVATSTADELVPGAAPHVAAALGATDAAAVDLGAACTGFVAGLSLAASLVESGRARHVLLVGADCLSRMTDFSDVRTAALFGDGAGAAVVSPDAGAGRIAASVEAADGAQAGLIEVRRDDAHVRMDGHATFLQAVRRICEATPAAASAAGLELEDIDLFVFHQANRRILEAVSDRLALPADKVVDAIGQLGNTSAASIPLALAQARAQGRLLPGTRALLAAVGAGFTWGAVVVEWGGE